MRRVALCLLLFALVSPVSAVGGWLAVANGGRDTVWRQPDGTFQVFGRPSEILARREFGSGVLSFAAAPDAARVAVHLRRGGADSVVVWDYASDTVTAAPDAAVAQSAGLAFAGDGRSLFVALPGGGCVREVGGFLGGERLLAAPRLPATDLDLSVAVSALDLYLAVASADCLYLGASRGRELVRYDLPLSATAPPSLRFTRDARWLVAAGDSQVAVLPSIGGVARRLTLSGVPATPAFDLSSDGGSLFVADAGRLCRLSVDSGRLREANTLRRDAARPMDAAISTVFGAVAVAYEDGKLYWYLPGDQRTIGPYPPVRPRTLGPPAPPGPGDPSLPPAAMPPRPATPSPTSPPRPPVKPPTPQVVATPPGTAATSPGSATNAGPKPDAYALVASAQAALAPTAQLFTVQPGAAVVVLDHEYRRMRDVEELATKQGAAGLSAALSAIWLGRPDLVPTVWQPLAQRLATVDMAELRGYQPTAPVGRFEAVLGAAVPTGTQQRGADGQTRPIVRFGVFALTLDATGAAFAPGCGVVLSAEYLK
ncbi:MAG: hypothetical protein HZB16_22365 [Armatimonadetes bacterium]|nr:hypothetical protein [Armatimonadota bacterium]